MSINKKQIIFLDTNILSDIGRFNEAQIRNIVLELSTKMEVLVAITPFNILEIEKIPDETVKTRIKYFLNLVNLIVLKGMDVLFEDEIKFYKSQKPVNPMQFITTLISKDKDGKPANYLSILNHLLSSTEYIQALNDHYRLIENQRIAFHNKLPISNHEFVNLLFREHLIKLHPTLANADMSKVINCCPSYISYAYSLYDKIGSKGLRKKAGEMNDTAMSYIFPYVGVVVTEKRQANLFNALKNTNSIPSLNSTIFLKHSDVFFDGQFKLNQALSSQN